MPILARRERISSPTISLTASAGVGSDALSSLFSHGMKVWSFAPSITLPLFTGGSNLAQLRYAEAQKRGLIATYEKTVQSAFKDVADALARRATLDEQLDAQRQYVAAERKNAGCRDASLSRRGRGLSDRTDGATHAVVGAADAYRPATDGQ